MRVLLSHAQWDVLVWEQCPSSPRGPRAGSSCHSHATSTALLRQSWHYLYMGPHTAFVISVTGTKLLLYIGSAKPVCECRHFSLTTFPASRLVLPGPALLPDAAAGPPPAPGRAPGPICAPSAQALPCAMGPGTRPRASPTHTRPTAACTHPR